MAERTFRAASIQPNQERWKDTPSAPVQQLGKGEVRVRETTPGEKERIRWDQECLRQRKLPENWRKSDDEIVQLARDELYGSSVAPEVAR